MDPTLNPHEAYLTKYWDVLAAIAWHEYNAHGRGALVVQNAGQRDEDAVCLPIEMLANPLTAPYATMAAEYDPHQEIVVIFMRPRCSVTAYRGALQGRNAPPVAPIIAAGHSWRNQK